MTELTTSQLIKIIAGIFLIVVVFFGIYLFFKNQVIDFFKGIMGGEEEEEGGVSEGSQIEQKVEKSYEIDSVIKYEENCEKREYNIFLREKFFEGGISGTSTNFVQGIENWFTGGGFNWNEQIFKTNSFEEANEFLKNLPPGKYYILAFCFNEKGRVKGLKTQSKNLEIK